MKKTLTSALENIITENTLIVCLDDNNFESEIIEQQVSNYLEEFIPSMVVTEKYFDLDGILLRLLNDNSTKEILFILPIDFGEKVGNIELIDPKELPNFTSSRSVTLQVLLEILKQQKKCYILGIQADVAEINETKRKNTLKFNKAIKELAEHIRKIITKKLGKKVSM